MKKILPVLSWTLAGALFVKSVLYRLYSSDLWWHLAAGRAMVQSHTFLKTDIFSHTLYGQPWINFEWLSQILFYGIYGLGGFWGLYLLKVLLSAGIVLLLIVLARQTGAQGALFFLFGWVGFKVVEPRLQDRPELFSLLFMGCLVWLLLYARRAAQARVKYFPLYIFGLMVLWVNMHGGFVYGLGVLTLFYIGAVWSDEKSSYQRFLLTSLALAGAALLLNPHGFKLGRVFWEHYQQLKASDSLIAEWKAPGVAQAPYFWALYGASALAMLGGFLTDQKKVRFWTPAVLIFCVWGTLYYRNSALLAFVAVPFLSDVVKVKKPSVVLWAVVLLPAAVGASALMRPLKPAPVAWEKFPVRACDFVRDNNLQGNMFNTYDVGGYIEWALGPERRVFMDGRYLFYPLLRDFDRHLLSRDYWMDKDVDYAIVPYPTDNARYLDGLSPFSLTQINLLFPRQYWALVFWDDAGLVFVKRTPAFAKLTAEHEYRALWPYNLEQTEYLLAHGLVKKKDAQAEWVRHEQETGTTIHGQQIENLLER